MKTDNALIAEFTGLKVLTKAEFNQHIDREHLNISEYSILEYQRYDKEWNWLMPVVEKIEALGQPFTIDEHGVHLTQSRGPMKGKGPAIIFDNSDGSKLQIIYKAVVEFIKWYNLNVLK